MNKELPKIQHVHFYNSARLHYYLCRHNTICVYTTLKNTTTKYFDITQSVHASVIDIAFHVV